MQQLTNHGSLTFYPHWSPDGQKIIFISEKSGNKDIWGIDADGSNQKQLTSSVQDDYGPVWSPDGQKLVYVSGSNSSISDHIWVMNANGANKQRFTDYEALGGEGNYNPRPFWSPDGNKIVFRSDRAGSWDIWIMDADGSNQKQLTSDEFLDWARGWSPDGKKSSSIPQDKVTGISGLWTLMGAIKSNLRR